MHLRCYDASLINKINDAMNKSKISCGLIAILITLFFFGYTAVILYEKLHLTNIRLLYQ